MKNHAINFINQSQKITLKPPSTPLAINILFCYSNKVLNETYLDHDQIMNDNNSLCDFTRDILNQNSILYDINIVNVCTIEVDDLQNTPASWSFPTSSIALLNSYVQGNLLQVNDLKELFSATVIVFETFFTSDISDVTAMSYTTGITSTPEACLCLCRSLVTVDKDTFDISPLILAHELGHLMGCRHPVGQFTTFESQYAGSYGHGILQNPRAPYDKIHNPFEYGDIMSYSNDRVYYYSNPTRFPYPEPYLDIAGGVVGVSEAYKIVEENLPKLAGIF
ncbi:hypothetical protein HPDP_00980 [Candidatus Hepatincola sp. Pdp]